jgi:hypothetical protein
MNGRILAFLCLFFVSATVVWPQAAVQVKRPGDAYRSSLDSTLHVLESVDIGDSAPKEPRKLRVGDSVMIRVTYDPKKTPVKVVELRFSRRNMEAMEAAKVVVDGNQKDGTQSLAATVRAVSEKTCNVAVFCELEDGTVKNLYFPFDIVGK